VVVVDEVIDDNVGGHGCSVGVRKLAISQDEGDGMSIEELVFRVVTIERLLVEVERE
jgi:hypothetical protein